MSTTARSSGVKGVLWTLICPGLGEYRLGHRALGASFMLLFLAGCVWLLIGAYGQVTEIAEYVKTTQPHLNAPPESVQAIAEQLKQLFVSIWTEYGNRRTLIHQRLGVQIWGLFGLYCVSLVQSYYLGVRKDRAAAEPPPAPGALKS